VYEDLSAVMIKLLILTEVRRN